jgi:hypothetical protein
VSNHDPECTWPLGEPCRKFSTDGTHLGAEIAHTMGTTSEALIAAGMAPNNDGPRPFVSYVDEEQAEWDADDEQECGEPKARNRIADTERREAEDQEGIRNGTVVETNRYGSGPHQHEPMRPYLASNCDWN